MLGIALGDETGASRILAFTGSRAEYGLMYPILQGIAADARLDLILIVSGSHLLPEFGQTVAEIETDGLRVDATIDAGGLARTGQDMAGGISRIIVQGADLLARVRPKFLLVLGDRYETLGMALAAFYQNVPIAHLCGGDVSRGGHLDDSVRHAITKLAHLHFVTSPDSAERVRRLGEEGWRVFEIGSPSVESVSRGDYASSDEVAERFGFNLDRPLILFTFHPVTTEVAEAGPQAAECMKALQALNEQTIITYPGNDAGCEAIILEIERYRNVSNFRIVKSLGRRWYLGVLRLASVVAGNSSSGIVETPAFRIPCVDIGSRQKGRLRGNNILSVTCNRNEITEGLRRAIFDEGFRRQLQTTINPYGIGKVSETVVRVLVETPVDKKLLQKQLTY
jgi:GDP/UDP-N,N'-diacetylbacillosamine 2-epimerase (hydrolysing)